METKGNSFTGYGPQGDIDRLDQTKWRSIMEGGEKGFKLLPRKRKVKGEACRKDHRSR